MGRLKKNRIVKFNPNVNYFKPRGIPMFELEEVSLTVDEREAIRLADFVGLSHEEAGRQMGVSRATFGRIVQRARKAVADAMINGKAIKVEGGNYNIVDETEKLICHKCKNILNESNGTSKQEACPLCLSESVQGN